MKNYISIVFIFLTIVAYETPFFIINSPLLNNMIKLFTPFVFLVLLINFNNGTLKTGIITSKENMLFLLYILLFVYLLIPSLLANNRSAALLYWLKYLYRFFYLFLFVVIIKNLKLSQIIFAFTWIGTILGIQSILFFYQITTGQAPDYHLRDRKSVV